MLRVPAAALALLLPVPHLASRSYVAWLRDRTSNLTKADTLRDSGCAESMAPVVAACGAGSDGDCVAAFRARFDKCAAGLRRRYSTAAATTGLTTCL